MAVTPGWKTSFSRRKVNLNQVRVEVHVSWDLISDAEGCPVQMGGMARY